MAWVNKQISNSNASKKSKEQWLEAGIQYYNSKHFTDSLIACEQAIQLDPDYAKAHNGKGLSLSKLGRYEEALRAYERAIQLDPDYAKAYSGAGHVLNKLGRYEDALMLYEHSIGLDPQSVTAYIGRADAFVKLKRYKDACAAYEQAYQIAPEYKERYKYVISLCKEGYALLKLDQYKEALEIFEGLNRIIPTFAYAYYCKGIVLFNLKQYEEALMAYEQAFQLGFYDSVIHESEEYRSYIIECFKEYRIHISEYYRAALNAYERIFPLDSVASTTYKNKAELLSKTNHFKKILTTLDNYYDIQGSRIHGDISPLLNEYSDLYSKSRFTDNY